MDQYLKKEQDSLTAEEKLNRIQDQLRKEEKLLKSMQEKKNSVLEEIKQTKEKKGIFFLNLI